MSMWGQLKDQLPSCAHFAADSLLGSLDGAQGVRVSSQLPHPQQGTVLSPDPPELRVLLSQCGVSLGVAEGPWGLRVLGPWDHMPHTALLSKRTHIVQSLRLQSPSLTSSCPWRGQTWCRVSALPAVMILPSVAIGAHGRGAWVWSGRLGRGTQTQRRVGLLWRYV